MTLLARPQCVGLAGVADGVAAFGGGDVVIGELEVGHSVGLVFDDVPTDAARDLAREYALAELDAGADPAFAHLGLCTR